MAVATVYTTSAAVSTRQLQQLAMMLATADAIGWKQLGVLYPDKRDAYLQAARVLIVNAPTIFEKVRKINGK